MKVTVCFDNVRVVVPCGDGTLLVKDLMHEATLRYKKATGKNDSALTINSLSSLTGGGLLDPDDRLCDVADDREQIDRCSFREHRHCACRWGWGKFRWN